MGCELGRAWHGAGYAKEACISLVNFGFTTLKLKRVYAETNAKNLAAIRLCKLLGLTVATENHPVKSTKDEQGTTVVLTISSGDWWKQQPA